MQEYTVKCIRHLITVAHPVVWRRWSHCARDQTTRYSYTNS